MVGKKQILSIVYCAIGYFILATFGLEFSFKDTNASPIWPAAGLGMYIACCHGWKSALGIIPGSLLANYFDFLRDQSQTDDWLIAAIISCGSYLQAVIGAYLLGYLCNIKKGKFFFYHMKRVLNFFQTMSIACMVAACIGIWALVVLRGMPAEIAYSVWLFWYIGDLAGVMVFCPMFAAIFYATRLLFIERVFEVAVPLVSAIMIYRVFVNDVMNDIRQVYYNIISLQILSILIALVTAMLVSRSVYLRNKIKGDGGLA